MPEADELECVKSGVNIIVTTLRGERNVSNISPDIVHMMESLMTGQQDSLVSRETRPWFEHSRKLECVYGFECG